MLLCRYDVALPRVMDDPERGLSRDPAFLRRTHERFASLLPSIATCDRTYRTDELSAEAIASDLLAVLP